MIRRTALVLTATIGCAVAGALVAPATADAAAHPVGTVSSAVQDTFAHKVTVRGWAFDQRKSSTSVVVKFYDAGKYLGRVKADDASAAVNSKYHIKGRHAYSFTFSRTSSIASVTARTGGIYTEGPRTTLATRAVKRVYPSAASRIITVAKRYVGHAKYRDGGATPKQGFDCSGYTKYVYAAAKVGKLPHFANSQRTMKRMHRVSAAKARPGDLVFYQSGGTTFHVAIYAGHHKQYAAATVRDGIRYQPIWSSHVVYGHFA